jgi:alkylation response protein AidB-like acyl-CoA dehydrogenase
MIASTTSSMSMFMEPAFAKEIYGDPKTITGGVYAPNGVATRSSDEWVVSGRWQWGSGSQHCQFLTGGTVTDSGEFHLMYFDAADVTIHDTWYVSGLRGTGSHDFSVDGARVPVGRSVQPTVSVPHVGCALAAFPNFTLLASGVAAVSLGIARHAIDEFTDLAQGKRPLFSSRTVSQSGSAQAVLVARIPLLALRAWMKRCSHASPTRERGNPYCGPNKTAAIPKSTNEHRNPRAEQDWDGSDFSGDLANQSVPSSRVATQKSLPSPFSCN